MQTTEELSRVPLHQLIATEAALMCPEIDLAERVRIGRQALLMADDSAVELARRQVAFNIGHDVTLWLLQIIDSARARREPGRS